MPKKETNIYQSCIAFENTKPIYTPLRKRKKEKEKDTRGINYPLRTLKEIMMFYFDNENKVFLKNVNLLEYRRIMLVNLSL